MMLALANGFVFDGIGRNLAEGVVVVIAEDSIVDLAQRPPAGATTLDLRGRVLMPGLIDAHVHVTATMLDVTAQALEPIRLNTARAVRILEGMLQRGFTTVRDAAGADWGLAAAIEDGHVAGPRLLHCGRALSPTGGHGDFRPRAMTAPFCTCCAGGTHLTRIVDGVDEMRRAAREELRLGASHLKIMASGGTSSPDDPLENLQFADEELAAAVWEARAWGRYVMAHAYTPEAIGRCVAAGVRTIEHGNMIDAPTARAVAAAGAWVVPTLYCFDAGWGSAEWQALPRAMREKWDAVRATGRGMISTCREAGVRLGFGTDLIGASHGEQARELLVRGELEPAADVLISATSGNAEMMQRKGELGVVAPGAIADLIAVDGNPLEDLGLLQEARHMPLILKGGRIVRNAL